MIGSGNPQLPVERLGFNGGLYAQFAFQDIDAQAILMPYSISISQGGIDLHQLLVSPFVEWFQGDQTLGKRESLLRDTLPNELLHQGMECLQGLLFQRIAAEEQPLLK